MKLEIIRPTQSLNRGYLKEKVKRIDFDNFKKQFEILISEIDKKESKEHLKNLLRGFLKNTFYQDNEINTKDRTDLAIYSKSDNKSNAEVIFEIKKPSNFSDMITSENPNKKALHEIILYYLRERLEYRNNEIKQVIITNLYEWFIFDAVDFERVFYQKELIGEYEKWKNGQKTSKNTDLFYSEIAKVFIEKCDKNITCTYFDIRDYYNKDEKTLLKLYKVFSAKHLLKLSHINDSNTLNTQFYNELLHIIGLEEIEENGKVLIKRRRDYKIHSGSIIENAISSLETDNSLDRVENLDLFGKKRYNQIFNVALELTINWINRILFLKLLEAQLIRYHRDGKIYNFINSKSIADFDELNELFFEVLAKKPENRNNYLKDKFSFVPYLNSSLFERSKLEDETIKINSLKSRFSLSIFEDTVLKNEQGEKLQGEKNTLQYLFDFLDAYDFSSEGAGEIQEENKNLINAAVLGLIFEKINGYKEGAFFTSGFITMFMCRENIRKAVIKNFLEAGFKLTNSNDINLSFKELRDKIENRDNANKIINSIKICDPSVGSGHFLVSALNEIIAIKSDLGILSYRNGNRIKYYKVEIENDELVVTDEETDEVFEYFLSKKNSIIKERQELQETIFHEKQTIIENCLFGVDINSNSVNICRLRLWIELLKNAYFLNNGNKNELQTLPNIDINIKQGNSLVSRFTLNGNSTNQKIRLATKKYKEQVIIYKNTTDKTTKKKAINEINKLKKEFASIANPTDKDYTELRKKEAELGSSPMIFTQEEKALWIEKINKLTAEIKILKEKYNQKLASFYGNAFEWRFEFPEVLDENGKFTGFDVIIGNPPYYQIQYSDFDFKSIKKFYQIYEDTGDIYSLFIEQATKLLKPSSQLSFIVSNRFCNTNYGHSTRKFLSQFYLQLLVNINSIDVFKMANVGTLIFALNKQTKQNNEIRILKVEDKETLTNLHKIKKLPYLLSDQKYFTEKQWIFEPEITLSIQNKMQKTGNPLNKISDLKINRGIVTGANNIFIIDEEHYQKFTKRSPKNKEILKPLLRGANIKPYQVLPANSYLILSETGIKIRNYNSIYKYLLENKEKLEQVYEARNGQKKWYELRKCSYYQDFEKEKIIWSQLSKTNSFAISTKKEYALNSTSFATGKNLKYYCSILNSKAVLFYFRLGSVIWGKDGIKWFGDYFDNIPIPTTDSKTMQELEILVEKIIFEKSENRKTDKIEKQIDKIVYSLYGLNKEEIKYIEQENIYR